MSELTFAIREAAAMLGVSPHTLRAWERRHSVPSPARTPSGQRRYSAEDVELLRQIKHQRRVHGYSMRVATMTAQGLIDPEAIGSSVATPGAGGRGVFDALRLLPDQVPEAVLDVLRLIPDLVPEVVVVLDAGGRVVHVNKAFARFTERLVGQLNGLPFADMVDPFERAKAVQMYRSPLRQRRGWELNLRARRRHALFSFDCWPVYAGGAAALVLIGHEVDAHRQMRDAEADLAGAGGRAGPERPWPPMRRSFATSHPSNGG